MSDKILDMDGNELLYWPVGAVKSGENSSTLDIQVECAPGRVLACEADPSGTVFGREGVNPYQDLSTAPLDLTPFGTGFHTFRIYFHATAALADPVRLPLTLGYASHQPANWNG
jgi:hypothetical protein